MIDTKPNETVVNKATIRWSLSKLALVAEGRTAWTYRVQRDDNSAAALRIFKPGHESLTDRVGNLLTWYRGDGAIRCYGNGDQCLLTEWVDGKLLAEPAKNGKDIQATSAIANLVGMLHVERPDTPAPLLPLRDYLDDFFDADVRLWPDTARDLYARSVGIAYGAFDKPSAEVPLHGAINHDCIVLAERGWVARAPLGLIGDPAFDLAASFLHPWGVVELAADPARINAMADLYADKLGYKRKRVLAFAAVHAAFSASKALKSGESINWHLAVLPNLLAVYDAA